MSSKYYSGQEHIKKRSRDAARCRRGQQNDEYTELANQLPVSPNEASQLDRLSVMRLANSFIKIKHFLGNLVNEDWTNIYMKRQVYSDEHDIENQLLQALDGFVFVIGSEGQCLYISDNVSTYLGLLPIEMEGNSFYKFIHPCDHEEVAKKLGGKIPLEDMEIFDGLFCSDSVFLLSNNLKGGSSHNREDEKQPYRSFFVRMKSTLTSRGKSVNLKASTYRVVHCMGSMKIAENTTQKDDQKCKPLCFVGIGVPLMFTSTFEVPLDRCTFTSHHTLDLKFIYCEEGIQDILGYSTSDVVGQSLYTFHHGCDSDVLTNCHKTLLTKGQCVSGYYRLLAKYGGWVWVQTKASIVYASKTCQPQFVLCIHYAISCVEKGNSIVSLDQLHQVKEHQHSPTNSPASKDFYGRYIKNGLPTRSLNGYRTSTNLSSVNDYQSGCNTDMMSDEEVCENDHYSRAPTLSPGSQSSVSYDGSEAVTSPADVSFYDNLPDDNPDKFAPFIPPPFGDTSIMMDSNITSTDNDLHDNQVMWNTEVWEIYDSADTAKNKKECNIRRNLSTPKFYPNEGEELPVLNSEEIEMSTPVQNLPLLQGNEIWFALDQSREIVA